MLTGNAIIKSLICENYPSFWYKMPNWHRNNKFFRSFLILCMKPCRNKMHPYGMMCKQQSKNEPKFAPHQFIYSTYANKPISQKQVTFVNKINQMKYMDMDLLQKINVWKSGYENELDYNDMVRNAYFEYEHLVEGICNVTNDSKIQGVCKSLFCTNRLTSPNICPDKVSNSNSEDDITSNNLIMLLKLMIKIITVLIILVSLNLFTRDHSNENDDNSITKFALKFIEKIKEKIKEKINEKPGAAATAG